MPRVKEVRNVHLMEWPVKPEEKPNKARCKRGHAQGICFAAFEEFPDLTNKEIAEIYPVGYSTVVKQRRIYMAEKLKVERKKDIPPYISQDEDSSIVPRVIIGAAVIAATWAFIWSMS